MRGFLVCLSGKAWHRAVYNSAQKYFAANGGIEDWPGYAQYFKDNNPQYKDMNVYDAADRLKRSKYLSLPASPEYYMLSNSVNQIDPFANGHTMSNMADAFNIKDYYPKDSFEQGIVDQVYRIYGGEGVMEYLDASQNEYIARRAADAAKGNGDNALLIGASTIGGAIENLGRDIVTGFKLLFGDTEPLPRSSIEAYNTALIEESSDYFKPLYNLGNNLFYTAADLAPIFVGGPLGAGIGMIGSYGESATEYLDGGGTKDGVYDKVIKDTFIDGILNAAGNIFPKPEPLENHINIGDYLVFAGDKILDEFGY